MLVCDTGPLVAAALHTDIRHHECVELFSGMHLAGRDLVLPPPVIAEVGYLLAREASPDVESSFLRSLADGSFKPVELTNADYTRMGGSCCSVRRPATRYHRRSGDRARRAPRC